MTPKEKAEELVKKYRLIFRSVYKDEYKYEAKQCALIAVDEIIDTLSPYMGDNNARNYWQQVKQEIEKL